MTNKIGNKKELKLEVRGDREVVLTRYFDATPARLFDCHTKPELMRRWLTPPEGWTCDSCEVDLKVGGRFLNVFLSPQKQKFGVCGTFKEIVKPERFVSSEFFLTDVDSYRADSPDDPNAALQTYTFVVHGEQTLMTLSLLYPSAEICKSALETGMADEACYEKLDELLAS
ncbi:MAG: SRPBCC domain-containing protein [Spirochaetia bacterium]|nr:SRPBCC domain-containing protein [Spirochaetia bacterium]